MDDNFDEKTFRQCFIVAATEWSRHKTLKVTLRKLMLPYIIYADPEWRDDEILSDENFSLEFD